MSRYFIEHPVFAWVIAILIAMGGLLAINGMGVESYPNIAPPQVTVAASYPGASAETTEGAVTQVIELPPLALDDELKYCRLSMPVSCCSITWVTAPSVVSALAPG